MKRLSLPLTIVLSSICFLWGGSAKAQRRDTMTTPHCYKGILQYTPDRTSAICFSENNPSTTDDDVLTLEQYYNRDVYHSGDVPIQSVSLTFRGGAMSIYYRQSEQVSHTGATRIARVHPVNGEVVVDGDLDLTKDLEGTFNVLYRYVRYTLPR